MQEEAIQLGVLDRDVNAIVLGLLVGVHLRAIVACSPAREKLTFVWLTPEPLRTHGRSPEQECRLRLKRLKRPTPIRQGGRALANSTLFSPPQTTGAGAQSPRERRDRRVNPRSSAPFSVHLKETSKPDEARQLREQYNRFSAFLRQRRGLSGMLIALRLLKLKIYAPVVSPA
jgi:hypothetical protein